MDVGQRYFNPRPDGPLDFPPPDGGGALKSPPPLSRLLGHVATRGKRHSKERQKPLRNHFGHFLGQVKGQVTRGHQRSNFAYFNIFRQTGA